jgi:hypothetical protein
MCEAVLYHIDARARGVEVRAEGGAHAMGCTDAAVVKPLEQEQPTLSASL